VPRLANLRQDPVLSRQANHLVDSLDYSLSGTVADKYSKQGWARCGGDIAPRVPTPWPQDHVIGHGRKSKLFYDDLNLYEWAQGVLAIIEYEEDVTTMRHMLSHYRSVFRDAQCHGFEAAKWSSGVVLSLLEKGKITWDQTYKVAEERRDALVAVSTPNDHSVSLPIRDSRPLRQAQFNGGNYTNSSGQGNGNSARSGNRKLVKACVFHNNGSCPNSGHHENSNTRWRHVCRLCWDPSHVERECTSN
jgi:hypothetical protein